MFKHPKYYKELRKLRNKLDQAIASNKLREPQATSDKHQAPSSKRQA
jgi:hypothetical protein